MGKAVTLTVALFVSAVCLAQSANRLVCRLGFSYEMSRNVNWGLDRPVITGIIPYSSAESAGLKQGDVIDAIDGIPLSSVTGKEIPQLLNRADRNEVELTVRTIANPGKKMLVRKECKKINIITEDQLALAFNMYSLETTTERRFVCPFKTTVTADTVDLGRFRSYAFAAIDENNRELENVINEYIHKELMRKGFIMDTENPDILVHTFYYFDKNPDYRGVNRVRMEKEPPVFRYDLSYNRMEQLPFLHPSSGRAEAGYLLQFGIRLVDQKEVSGRVLWECEANEWLEQAYRLEDYARIHVPLMCMQYPYVKYTRNVPFTVDKKTYNYTGIRYDVDRLELVSDVDRNSPAYAAGIRTGDVIERIGRNRMKYTPEQFSEAYRRFVANTLEFRNPKTLFTDAKGFRYCMYWDELKYTEVSDAIYKSDYLTAFSYLYYFTPYVNPSGNNACVFHIQRGREKREVTIRPTIRTELTIEVK
jgi:hypothetical protein